MLGQIVIDLLSDQEETLIEPRGGKSPAGPTLPLIFRWRDLPQHPIVNRRQDNKLSPQTSQRLRRKSKLQLLRLISRITFLLLLSPISKLIHINPIAYRVIFLLVQDPLEIGIEDCLSPRVFFWGVLLAKLAHVVGEGVSRVYACCSDAGEAQEGEDEQGKS